MAKKYSEILWVEKYRPKKIKDIIVPDRIRHRFEEGEIGANLLFGGTAGIGKTTLAKILSADRSCLFINASQERGIDTVRTKIKDFASTASLVSSKKKVIILDEADNFSSDAQKALKGAIEAYTQNVFFIFTANNPERLISPLMSRLEYINFNFSAQEEQEVKKQYLNRIKFILSNEGRFKIENEALIYVMKKVYPDLRQIINLLYQATRNLKEGDTITHQHVATNYAGDNDEFFEFIIKEFKPEKIYQYVKSNFTGKEIGTLNSLGHGFLEFLNNHEKHFDKTLAASMIVHKYTYEASTGAIDPLIPLLACSGALSELFKS